MQIKDNRIVGVPFKASPNIGGKLTPKYLIQHYDASPNATGAISWMVSPKSKVSAHLHIDREGNVVQLVDFNRTAYHAGVSQWAGIVGLNSHSIGIEIQNSGLQQYTPKQMDAVIEVSNLLVQHYKLKEVLGHQDISPIRKSDPESAKFNLFDWVSVLRGCCFEIKSYTTTADLNIRRGQGTQFPIVLTIPKETELYELTRVGEWSKVQLKGSLQCGWISNKFIS